MIEGFFFAAGVIFAWFFLAWLWLILDLIEVRKNKGTLLDKIILFPVTSTKGLQVQRKGL